ncbi:MAG TPA: hypothetical protein VHU18_00430 [Rhizomicrobium sp.]|jgi:hypothetical protein|nr:hypothetical protein [Rhizomicrobium sp.]
MELERLALDIEAELRRNVYHATAAELAGIQRGFEAAEQSRFPSDDEEIEALFAQILPIMKSILTAAPANLDEVRWSLPLLYWQRP